jgi:hypothetical protein
LGDKGENWERISEAEKARIGYIDRADGQWFMSFYDEF